MLCASVPSSEFPFPTSPPQLSHLSGAAIGNALSSNEYRPSTTITREDCNEDNAGWRNIAQEKRGMVIPDQQGTLKPAPRRAPPKPLTHGVCENEYEGEGDKDENGQIATIRSAPALQVFLFSSVSRHSLSERCFNALYLQSTNESCFYVLF
ncbi:hypothetical protein DL96DRAFT_1722725 [Flagelloscypha sp. PMI_526]|nr:hypothetical protein DL96DRAFT_1722725 [Flagelloscypha sp. PMI_526]